MITYQNQFNEHYIDDIVSVYRSVGWNSHDTERVRTIFSASTHVVLAFDEKRIIGSARALSDGVYNAAVYDVIVRPDYQGRGIAREMMERLLDSLGELSCIHLISTTDNEPFYRKLGFRDLTTGMAIYSKPDLRKKYTK